MGTMSAVRATDLLALAGMSRMTPASRLHWPEANSASLYGYSGNIRTLSPTAHGARLSIHPLMLGKDHRRAPGGCAGMDQALASE
jgi:hypothetical protein